MTTNSPFPWLATADPTPPHTAAAPGLLRRPCLLRPVSPPTSSAGRTAGHPRVCHQGGAHPPRRDDRPRSTTRASGRGAVARTTSAGWPLPSGALTHHPAADPGEPGGHGVIATVGGRQDPRLADDLASPDDQPAAPPAEPWPPRAPADEPPRDASGLGGPTGLAPVLHSRPDEVEPASPTADQWPAPGPDGMTGPPAPPAQRHPAEDAGDLAASLVTAAAGREQFRGRRLQRPGARGPDEAGTRDAGRQQVRRRRASPPGSPRTSSAGTRTHPRSAPRRCARTPATPTTAGTPPRRAGTAGVANVSTSSFRRRRYCAWRRASSWCH